MTKGLGLLAALLMMALLALSGCNTLEAIVEKSAQDKAQEASAVAAFKFYDSWANW